MTLATVLAAAPGDAIGQITDALTTQSGNVTTAIITVGGILITVAAAAAAALRWGPSLVRKLFPSR